MQAADIQRLKNRRDEDAINFRPSPNFKHMKKYLKSKFEEANASGGIGIEQTSAEEEEQKPRANGTRVIMLQPPLPPNPPPPDSPPPLALALKEELPDEEEEEAPPAAPAAAPRNERVMCRQWARGACTRGAACIYAHELILDQLPGIYTFCKNFQNSGCNFPRCKFVHATVFEKECFYRTGYLPPHSLAHLKENAAAPPPPAPAPAAATEVAAPPGAPAVFANPPPPVMLPGMSVGAGVEPALGALGAAAAPPSLKQSPGSRDSDADPPSNKCKNCDLNEIRLQCNKSKVEKLRRSTEEIEKKMSQLAKKNNKLCTVVVSLLRNTPAFKTGAAVNHVNNSFDKDKAIWEKFNMLLSANNRHSLVDEDNNSKNMSTVLVRLLLSTGEGGAGDAS